jgi:hypothetical protein
MGFLKDMRTLKQQTNAMVPPEHRGFGGGMRALRDLASESTLTLAELQREAAVANHLAIHGIPGRAIITAIKDTATTVNDNPRVELTLEVTVGDDAPYTATHAQVISRIAVAGFQPGATVPVRVDPADGQSLIIG